MDPHYPSARQSLWYTLTEKALRRGRALKMFKREDAAQLARLDRGGDYAVFPLNTEPEAALLVYGRVYRNQIETVRNIASSIPVGWRLVVKEHPAAVGYRSYAFYRKIREIPNVILLGPAADTHKLLEASRMVFVVFGTIGFEAILKRKPLIVFCKTPYGLFPDNMVRYVKNMLDLGEEIRYLLKSYNYDEWAVICYIAAHIEGSVPLNLFTELLGKGGRKRISSDYSIEEQYRVLARYAVQRIGEEERRLTASSSTSRATHKEKVNADAETKSLNTLGQNV